MNDETDIPEPESGEDITPEQHAKYHWGVAISEERQAWLRELADKQREWAAQPEAARGESVFNGVWLTGAEVCWLAMASGRGPMRDAPNLHLEGASLGGAHLEGADLGAAHLEGADLRDAHLEGAFLSRAYLEEARLRAAHLEGADLRDAHLEGAFLIGGAHLDGSVLIGTHLNGANLRAAHLNGAYLSGAHLEGADLRWAYLDGADLSGAHLDGAGLRDTHLEGAILRAAHLEGAGLHNARLAGKEFAADDPEWQRIHQVVPTFPTTLAPADLRAAFFDAATILSNAVLTEGQQGAVRVADVRWGGVNLAVIPDWSSFTERHIPLGDEREAWAWRPKPFTESGRQRKLPRQQRMQARAVYAAEQAKVRLDVFQQAVRANRQLATTLRAQGMNEQADYFAYRAQVVQRAVLRQQHKWGRAFGSWLLDRVAGYGYQPMRSVITYLLVVGLFAVAYFFFGGTHGQALSWNEALVVSLTAFHGRGFFATAFQPGDPQAALAAIEAVIGLLIEITFIATFTQRFFAR